MARARQAQILTAREWAAQCSVERPVSYVTGLANVRDVIACRRTPGSARY